MTWLGNLVLFAVVGFPVWAMIWCAWADRGRGQLDDEL